MNARYEVRKVGDEWHAIEKKTGLYTVHRSWQRSYRWARFASHMASVYAALADFGKKLR